MEDKLYVGKDTELCIRNAAEMVKMSLLKRVVEVEYAMENEGKEDIDDVALSCLMKAHYVMAGLTAYLDEELKDVIEEYCDTLEEESCGCCDCEAEADEDDGEEQYAECSGCECPHCHKRKGE